MDKISLEGVVDMHVHASPDLRPRRYDDFELCKAAAGVGARAVVLKSHLGDTTARAYLANRRNLETHPDSAFQAVGSVTLNRCVGGINPEAVENALNFGAKVVWLPTVSAGNHLEKLGKPLLSCVEAVRDGKPVTELYAVMELIRAKNAVLATGHLSGPEIFTVVKAAREMGLEKIVITHPEWWMVGLSLEEQKTLAWDYGAVLERCFAQNRGVGVGHGYISNLPGNLEAVRKIGFEHILISTDGGQAENPPWEEEERAYLQYLVEHGVPVEQVQYMSGSLPCCLLDL